MNAQAANAKTELSDEILTAIENRVTKEISWNEDAIERQRKLTFNAAYAMLALIFVLFLLIFTSLGETLGLQAGWITTANGAEALATQPNEVISATRNFITVLGPIFLGIIIWLVTVTAERRLKQYDEAIDKFRSSMDQKLENIRGSIDTRLNGFQQLITEESLKNREEVEQRVQDSIASTLREEIEKQKEEFSKNVDDYRQELNASTQKVEKTRAEIEGRFGHIADTTDYAKNSDDIINISSVGAVKKAVERLFFKKEASQAANLTRELLDAFHRRGGSDRPGGDLDSDWFNLSAELGRQDEEKLALEICIAGLEQQNGEKIFSANGETNWTDDSVIPHRDLVAHAMKYAETVGDKRLPLLIELSGYDEKDVSGMSGWKWRSYDFTMQALASLGRHREAIRLGERFMNERPIDKDTNKVVQTLAMIMANYGQKEKAMAMLVDWLRENPYAPAAQIVSQVSEWLEGSDETDKIIESTSRGIRDLAEEQASVQVGGLYYRRALARDKRAIAITLDGNPTGIDICDEIAQAMNDYEMAISTGIATQLHPQLNNRRKILKSVAKKAGCEEHEFENDDDEDGISAQSKADQIVETLLPILSSDEIPDDKKGEEMNKILMGEPDIVKAAVLQTLQSMSSD